MNHRLFLKWISRDKCPSKPEIFSVGGFTSKAKDGREYCFDWTESSTCMEINEDGYLEVECELRDFDDEYFRDSNKLVRIEEITPQFILDSTLEEVFYECNLREDESPEGEMELNLMEFVIFGSTGMFQYDKEQMRTYRHSQP